MAVKKILRFEDLDGNPVEEEWYFQLGKTDALEMDVFLMKDPAGYLKKIVEEGDARAMLTTWKEILFHSVGKRVGNRLTKNEELVEEFRHGGAFEQLLSELLESEDAGASFFASIMPADVREKAEEQANRTYTKAELMEMSDEEFAKVAGTDPSAMTKEHLTIAFARKSGAAA